MLEEQIKKLRKAKQRLIALRIDVVSLNGAADPQAKLLEVACTALHACEDCCVSDQQLNVDRMKEILQRFWE